jgi:glutamyl-tRNA reductase
MLANSIVNKIIHDPIISLKEECQDNGAASYLAAVRRLFKLDQI